MWRSRGRPATVEDLRELAHHGVITPDEQLAELEARVEYLSSTVRFQEWYGGIFLLVLVTAVFVLSILGWL